MDLNTSIGVQLDSLTTWLRNFVEEHDTPPSVEMWKEVTEGIIERADFVDRYITPKVIRMLNGERLTVKPGPMGNGRVAEFFPAPRKVGVAGSYDDVDQMHGADRQ